MVGRKEELDDLIAAFGPPPCTRSIPIPSASVVRTGRFDKTRNGARSFRGSAPSSTTSGSAPPAWTNSGNSGSPVKRSQR